MRVNKSLDIYLSEIKDSLNFIAINKDIISTLQNSASNLYVIDQNFSQTRISVLLNDIFAEKTDIRGYFIYNFEHKTVFINSGRSIDFNSPF